MISQRRRWVAGTGGTLPPPALDLQEHALTVALDVFKLEVDEFPNAHPGAEQDPDRRLRPADERG